MAKDFSKLKDEEVMELLRGGFNANQAQPVQASPTQPQSQVQTLLDQIMKKPKRSLTQNVGDAITRLGGGQPTQDDGTDLSKLYAQEAIKSRFEDPTVRQLREAEIKALETPPPAGFVRIGRQIQPDPDYIKPKEQREIDDAERIKKANEDLLRSSAEDNLKTIETVENGSQFFGPLGEVPSQYAPSSFMGMGNYRDRVNWESNVDKLLSQQVMDVMTEMRNASKTGSTGFGQLTQNELAILKSASTALNKKLDPRDAVYYLGEMKKIHRKMLGYAPSEQGSQQVASTQRPSPQAPQATTTKRGNSFRILQ